MKIKIALFLLFLVISGCSTPGEVRLDNLSQPLADLQKVIESNLPTGRRAVSSNGRTFFSNYFGVKKDGTFEAAKEANPRYSAEATVLGDRRPYTVAVIVKKEKRDTSGGYVSHGNDERLARVISRRIQKALHERRDDRSIIDDFRVF